MIPQFGDAPSTPHISNHSEARRKQAKNSHVPRRKYADVVATEDDRWVWGVILTTALLSALCVAMLFSVTLG